MNNINDKKMKKPSILKDIIIEFMICLIAVVTLNKYILFNVRVPSESMHPTINKGDNILTFRTHNKDSIKRGDILVFNSQELNAKLIKRVIGLPNDNVRIDVDGSIYINGGKLNESYSSAYSLITPIEFNVPSESYFFMGDNRTNSYDSRYWNNPYIHSDSIMGKATFRYFPFNRIGLVK